MISSFIPRRKRPDQADAKVSCSRSSLSIEAGLNILKYQEVLGKRTFDPIVINMLEMREFLEMVKFLNWVDLFSFDLYHMYGEEVKVFYYILEIFDDRLYLTSQVNNMEKALDEETPSEIL